MLWISDIIFNFCELLTDHSVSDGEFWGQCGKTKKIATSKKVESFSHRFFLRRKVTNGSNDKNISADVSTNIYHIFIVPGTGASTRYLFLQCFDQIVKS